MISCNMYYVFCVNVANELYISYPLVYKSITTAREVAINYRKLSFLSLIT